MNLLEQLENGQIYFYIAAIILARLLGWLLPDYSVKLDHIIPFALAVLMYGMFAQIPFYSLKEALFNKKFIYALLVMNYILVPGIVCALLWIFPVSPGVLLGVLLILLTPCIDYVIVFTKLGQGDEKIILLSTPLLFISQMLLLPVYLWIFMGKESVLLVNIAPFVEAFLTFIVIPLCLAIFTQWWAKRHSLGLGLLKGTGWLPVPFMALTLFVIIASQFSKMYSHFDLIGQALFVYAAYIVIVPVTASMVARVFKLETRAGRALVFSASTRNSLVVLPFALALPEPASQLAAAVIVSQTMMELVGELIYLRVVPEFLLPPPDSNMK